MYVELYFFYRRLYNCAFNKWIFPASNDFNEIVGFNEDCFNCHIDIIKNLPTWLLSVCNIIAM